MKSVTLLGPQRVEPTVRETVEDFEPRGRVALITAGWEEREDEDQELAQHLGRETVNLAVYRRGETVFEKDRELFEAMQARHDRLRAMADTYRLRLAHGLQAARELFEREERAALGTPDLAEAIEAVRTLDAAHLARVREVHEEFDAEWRVSERREVTRQRAELERELRDVEVVCIAGGHVAILLNRLRLLGFEDWIGARRVVAWSAGAMVLTERIVLFHDSPPQGPGDAEVFDAGFAAAPRLVALPHAAKRLRLDDPARVSLFARRLAPARCAVLEAGVRLHFERGKWRDDSARSLSPEGHLTPAGV